MSLRINRWPTFSSEGSNSTIRMSVFTSRLIRAHHVQAATVYQGSELMQTNLRCVQYPLDLFQTLLKIEEKIRTKSS